MAKRYWVYDKRGFYGVDCLTDYERKQLEKEGFTFIAMTDEEFQRLYVRKDKRDHIPGF